MIIRNACKQESSPWSNLPEIDIVRIFQFARPESYNREREEEQALLKSKKKTKPRKYDKYEFRRSEYQEQLSSTLAKVEEKEKAANRLLNK